MDSEMRMGITYLEPGQSHPSYPHWKVEQVFHSPEHMGLTKFQWTRRDGVRATLMGWLGLFDEKRPYIAEKHSNIGCDFDINLKDHQIPMGETDRSLVTIRWYSWESAKSWPLPKGSRPMEWDEAVLEEARDA